MAQTDLRTAIYRYCNYQERCHQEVRNKLYELGATTQEVESLIAELIEQDLLNEERFARALARGKFRIKGYGRVRITQQLKQFRISEYCIRKAMTEIEPEEYAQRLERLSERKWEELRGERNPHKRRQKLYQYLIRKGYESDLVQQAIQEQLAK